MFDVFRRKLTVYRKGDGSFAYGYWQDGEEHSFEILSSVQGTDAEILETLPEGYRTRESYTLFTDSRLNTAVTSKNTPDMVLIDGQKFIVAKVSTWQHLDPTKHYEVVVVRENVDE
jgi:hypothetical protein